MKLKICLIVFAILVISVVADAGTLIKGSVPGGGTRQYVYLPPISGHVQITLLYDNPTSDLDLALGFFDENGDPQFSAVATSSLQFYERLETSVSSNVEYRVLVDSYRGGSAFRLMVTSGSPDPITIAGAALKELVPPAGDAFKMIKKMHIMEGLTK